jgi:hypothetical protein
MGKKLQYFRRTESVEDELNERKLFNLDTSQELRMALPARISSLFERRDADPVASVIHDVKTIVETHGCCVTNDSWLRDGQLDNNTLFMLCFIYALASDEHPGAMGFLRDFCYRRNALRILNRLVHCQRWTRIWVVQETVLAPNATLMFGSFSIPWSIISLAATNLDRHSSRCCAQGLKNLPVHDMGVHGDKIYGLFGLISHRPDPVISPDYSLATVEVYRRAVLTLLDTPSSFSVLRGTLGKHSYPTIERQTNRNHSPTTSSIATFMSPSQTARMEVRQLGHTHTAPNADWVHYSNSK